VLLGKDAGLAIPTSVSPNNISPGTEALTRLAINPTNNTATTGTPTASNRFQVIRTGTGNIEIFAAKDVQLLNQFATIYTAGVQVANGTNVFAAGDFVVPVVTQAAGFAPSQPGLGAIQQLYPARFSMAGGNVTVSAQSDIIHLTKDSLGNLIDDSSRELPNNWLMRRGYVDPSTGLYGAINVVDGGTRSVSDASASTTWWVNFSNFFDGIATLGGGNVSIIAGRDVKNVSAHAPTNARAARGTPSAEGLLELGGGDVLVQAGRDINAGVYYVERGNGTLKAGNMITTNATRSPSLGILAGGAQAATLSAETWLPTTLMVGKSSFKVTARDDLLLGPVVNTMLLPQGVNNKHWYKTYFSTYSPTSSVTANSLAGDVTFRQAATTPTASSTRSLLSLWMSSQLLLTNASAAFSQPWLRLAESSIDPFDAFTTLMPGTLRSIAFSGDINLVGKITLSPSPVGNVELLAAGAFNGLRPTGVSSSIIQGSQTKVWASGTINLSDANPSSIPGVLQPFSYFSVAGSSNTLNRQTDSVFLQSTTALFAESGSTSGEYALTQTKQTLHAPGLLHANDTTPLRIYAATSDISGLTLFSGKSSMVIAERDISDVAFYIQNVRASDTSIVSSGRDIVAYNANSVLRTQAVATSNLPAIGEAPKNGDLQISGPGTMQVLAGRDLNLGTGSNNSDGTGVGITSIGNGRNPYLPFAGADVIVAAGMGGSSIGLSGSNAQVARFIKALTAPVAPVTDNEPDFAFDEARNRYLAEAKGILGILADSTYDSSESGGVKISTLTAGGPAEAAGLRVGDIILQIADKVLTGSYDDSYLQSGIPLDQSTQVTFIREGVTQTLAIIPGSNKLNLTAPALTPEAQAQWAIKVFNLMIRDAGRDHNDPDNADYGTYKMAYEAIQTLFPAAGGIDLIQGENRPIPDYPFAGSVLTQGRNIRTRSGGDISILTPGGGLQLANTQIGNPGTPPGIITETGGDISIFADNDVNIGISRIFTLRGGDISIWSTVGDVAAGSSSKTVQSAPPTRVLIDPQSASVATDLAGLATGGGIGVLATVAGVAPGNVDLIAPIGAVDAGDAGIRATGNLNIAAAVVLNAANISVGGTSAGAPSAPAVSTPALGGLASAAAAGAATNNSPAAQQASKQDQETKQDSQTPSIITVEVLGYGGGEGDDEKKRRGGAE